MTKAVVARVMADMTYSSHYLTMRDGVRIAVDCYVPDWIRPGQRVPAIVKLTRYHRSMELRWPFRLATGGLPLDHTGLYAKRRQRFLDRGYAWLDVDARGSGASFGTRLCPWSPDEVRDGAELVDWIVRQPWSDGKVGATGNSYDGTAAEFLLVNKHPAVRAVAIRFACFDAFTDVAYPGGIHFDWFTEAWRSMNDALDRNAPWELVGRWAKLFITGVHPVAGDHDRSTRDAAIRAHRDNYNVHAGALEMAFRDDVTSTDPFHAAGAGPSALAGEVTDPEGSVGLFSPHNYARELRASGAAIYNISGWMDGGYQHAAIKRYLTVQNPGSRLLLGPWNHAGRFHYDPFGLPRATTFDHDRELLRFFDLHLRGVDTGIGSEKPVRYFTLGEERWKEADTWPPPGGEPLRLFLAPDGRLSREAPTEAGELDVYRPDPAARTGELTRWKSLVSGFGPVWYPDRAVQDERLLTYTSEPLTADLEVTGHPVITLHVSATAPDLPFVVYLEDVDPLGRVGYVTEGLLRALQRRLSDAEPPYAHVVPYRTFKRGDAQPLVPGEVADLVFDLLPTSYLFRAGHALRVAVACADTSHFSSPPGGLPTVRVHRERAHPSHITLPTAV